mgnify:CR=1 FL=1
MVAPPATLSPSTSTDRVSVITPCYQQGELLADAIESVRAQTHPHWEMIVVNDGSTDRTSSVVRGYSARQPQRVLLLEQPNRGQARARQAALRRATGDYLVLLDADDLLEPEMMRVCLRELKQRPEAAAVAADAWMVGPDGRRHLRLFHQHRSRPWPDVLEGNPHGALAGLMFRTPIVRALGGLGLEGTPGCEDWDLIVRLARAGCPVASVPRRLARYRQTPQSYHHKAGVMLRAELELLERAARQDPRLQGCPRVKAPIPPHEHLRLRQIRVMNALGRALADRASGRVLGRIGAHVEGQLVQPECCARTFRYAMQSGASGCGESTRKLFANPEALLETLQRCFEKAGRAEAWSCLQPHLVRELAIARKQAALSRRAVAWLLGRWR